MKAAGRGAVFIKQINCSPGHDGAGGIGDNAGNGGSRSGCGAGGIGSKEKCGCKKKGQSESAKHWGLQGEIRVVQATKKEAKSASEKVYNQAKRKLPPRNCL